jgi:hypothetical protein
MGVEGLEAAALPEAIRPLHNEDEVHKIVEYQSGYADYSVILDTKTSTQLIRVFYLKHLRDDWEIVDYSQNALSHSFVLLKEK